MKMRNYKLLRILDEKKLRQYEFAAMVKEDQTVLSRVINGIKKIDKERQNKYAQALGVNVDDLFDNEDCPE